MALPDLIEIVPLDKPVRAEITVPGSKSITNRALILAALADGETVLSGALWSEDTQVMVEALQQLGFQIKVEKDPAEFCNRAITIQGLGGKIPKGGTVEKPLELFVGNAGTAARFLAAFVCLGKGVYRLHGVPRMHERPQAALFDALRQLGYRVDSPNDKLPAVIFGGSSRGNEAQTSNSKKDQSLLTSAATVSIEESSQFASALLLCAKQGGWKVEVVGENAEESPYVAMTLKMIEAFPTRGGKFQIEPDASSGSYFWAAGQITGSTEKTPGLSESQPYLPSYFFSIGKKIDVMNWPQTGWQIDEKFQEFLIWGPLFQEFPRHREQLRKLATLAITAGAKAVQEFYQNYINSSKGEVSRRLDLGDSIMTAIVIAPLDPWIHRKEFIKFTDLGRLRVQECERVTALRTELTKCGAKVVEEGDTLTVYPSQLHGAEIETYNDHRMAMCFAILGLKVPGIKIQNPACVKKTFPNFFQKLAAPPPGGLGAAILDGRTGRKLAAEELFAE